MPNIPQRDHFHFNFLKRSTYTTIPWTSSRPSHDCCRSSFFNFFIFYFSLHSLLDGGIWFQTVEFGSVLECDWKMRFIVPKNHPGRKRISILVEWGRKKLKLIDFLSQSWSAQTNGLGCAHPFGSVASDAQNPRHIYDIRSLQTILHRMGPFVSILAHSSAHTKPHYKNLHGLN